LPLRQSTFDCVFCSEVLEHLRRPTTAACELAKAVRDGGRVVVTAPNKLSPFELISCVRKKFRLPSFAGPRSEPPVHESYTCTGLKYLLERAGLKTVRVTTTSLGWRIVFEGSRRDTGQT